MALNDSVKVYPSRHLQTQLRAQPMIIRVTLLCCLHHSQKLSLPDVVSIIHHLQSGTHSLRQFSKANHSPCSNLDLRLTCLIWSIMISFIHHKW